MIVNAINFLILVLFFYGRSLARKNKSRHSFVMILVMSSDFALLLFLTFARQALGKVGGGMPPLLIVHIILAVITVIAYGFAVANGIKLLSGDENVRSRMKQIDLVAVPCRTLVFVSSVMLYLSKASEV